MFATNKSADSALLAQMLDLLRRAQKSGIARFSKFLNEQEQAVAQRFLDHQLAGDGGGYTCEWFGGYEGAQRRVVGLFPPEKQSKQAEKFPIVAFRAQFPKGVSLTHRDFLGALLALGIKREVVGDILVDGNTASFFIRSALREWVLQELRQVGRLGICLEETDGRTVCFTQRFEESNETVASLRLDCIVGALAHCSRQGACELIRSGRVHLGGRLADKADRLIQERDVLSIRGTGKFLVETENRVTRKGRLCIHIKRYL